MGKEEFDAEVREAVNEAINNTKGDLASLVGTSIKEKIESGDYDEIDIGLKDHVDFRLKIAELKKLDFKTLRELLDKYEFALVAMSRDEEPCIREMDQLRLQLKKIHRVISIKLDEASAEDFCNYKKLINATKKKDENLKNEIIPLILGPSNR